MYAYVYLYRYTYIYVYVYIFTYTYIIHIHIYKTTDLELTDSSYRPFNKTNNEINYIHKHLNHPPSIIKQLPLSVKRRLSKLSSNEKIFNDCIPA